MTPALVDPHVKVLDERVRRLAIQRGLDAIVYAPHYTAWPSIVERAERFTDDRLMVVPAREVFTGTWRDRKHVLAIGLSQPVPDFLSLETTLSVLAEQDAAVVAPHPGYLTMSLSPGDVEVHRDVFDAVEVYNPKFLPWHEHRARRLAERLDLSPVASSYAHLRGSVGAAAVQLERSVSAPRDVVDALRNGAISDVEIPAGTTHWRRSAPELAHLAWENTGARIRRSVARGAVATHPSAPVYEGRFTGPSD